MACLLCFAAVPPANTRRRISCRIPVNCPRTGSAFAHPASPTSLRPVHHLSSALALWFPPPPLPGWAPVFQVLFRVALALLRSVKRAIMTSKHFSDAMTLMEGLGSRIMRQGDLILFFGAGGELPPTLLAAAEVCCPCACGVAAGSFFSQPLCPAGG